MKSMSSVGLVAYPLVGILATAFAWEAAVQLMQVSPIVIPAPSKIYAAATANFSLLMRQSWPTLVSSALGFLLALAIGIPLAVAVTSSRLLNLIFYPILVATQTIPKIAIAPVVLVWFGLGIESKLALAFLVAFFPIVVDTAAGLSTTPKGLLDLARSLRATRGQIFWKMQLPAALPHIFAGAKVAVTLAVIGAVMGEFVGSNEGLGNLLLAATSQLNGALAWAALAWLSVLGGLLFLTVVSVEWLATPWSRLEH